MHVKRTIFHSRQLLNNCGSREEETQFKINCYE